MMSVIPPVQFTQPETFILESLSIDDEKNQRMDGKVLYEVLRLQGKNPIYYYFRTQVELIKFSDVFRQSGYRKRTVQQRATALCWRACEAEH